MGSAFALGLHKSAHGHIVEAAGDDLAADNEGWRSSKTKLQGELVVAQYGFLDLWREHVPAELIDVQVHSLGHTQNNSLAQSFSDFQQFHVEILVLALFVGRQGRARCKYRRLTKDREFLEHDAHVVILTGQPGDSRSNPLADRALVVKELDNRNRRIWVSHNRVTVGVNDVLGSDELRGSA